MAAAQIPATGEDGGVTNRFPRKYANELHVAAETRKDAHSGDHAYRNLPRFVPISNLDFKTGIAPPTKYGNVKTDGYDSKREANRAAELKLLEHAGEISELRFQVEYLLIPAQYEDGKCVERACTYTVDFQYMQGGKLIAEDAKGYADHRWPIKRKLMRFVHKIAVREV